MPTTTLFGAIFLLRMRSTQYMETVLSTIYVPAMPKAKNQCSTSACFEPDSRRTIKCALDDDASKLCNQEVHHQQGLRGTGG